MAQSRPSLKISGGSGIDSASPRATRRAVHAAAAAARVDRALVILGDQVPEHLAAVAAVRMTHREVSLEALGRMLDPPMTKDAVAGRIRRLLALEVRGSVISIAGFGSELPGSAAGHSME